MTALVGSSPASEGARTGNATVLSLCVAAALLEGFDIQAMGIAGPKMVPALGLSASDAGLLFSASLLGMIPGALGGGWLADRLRHGVVLPVALAMFGLFTLLTAVVADYTTLIVIRILAGLGLGAAMPSIIAVAAESVSPARRAATVTSISAGLPAGAALAALAGRLTIATDWRILFYIGGVLPIILAVIAFALLAGTRRAADEPRAAVEPASPLSAGWRLATSLLGASYLFTLMALLLLMNWLPLMLADSGIALGVAGLLVLGFNVGGTIGGLALGQASARWGSLRSIAVTFALLVGLLVLLGTTSFSLPVLALILGGTGFLLMGGQCLLYGMGAALYPAAMRARGVGFAVSAGRVGAMIGPALAGALIASRFDLGGVLLVTATIVAVAGAAAVSVGSARRASQEGESIA